MKELKVLNFDADIKTVQVDWLWYPYIPFRKLTIINGDPGSGKTMLSAYMLSKTSLGEALDGSDEQVEPITSIYLNAEDGLSDTIKPRLEMLKANCEKIYSIDELEDPLSMQDERIEAAIVRTNARLVILDPIQAYLGADVDMHRANEVRPVLKHLGSLAEKYNCAIVLIGHMNKGNSKALYKGVGSIDFAAFARSILTIGRIKNEDIRAIMHTKSSLAPAGSTLAFNLSIENGFQWLGEYDISEDDLLSGSSGTSKLEQAKHLINRLLQDGPMLTTKIMEEAKNFNIGKTTMNAAKEQLKVKSIKKNDVWYWTIQ